MFQVLQEIEFCKSQIKKYSELYESLLTKHGSLLSMNLSAPPTVNRSSNIKKGKCSHKRLEKNVKPESFDSDKSDSGSSSESESSADSESSSESESETDLTAAVVDFIINNDRLPKSEKKSLNDLKFTPSAPVTMDERSDNLCDELTDFIQNDHNKNNILNNMREDEQGIKQIDKRKYDARSGLKDHDDKLTKIHNEERRLLAQGLNPEEVRKRVREMYYPEAIPAGERKTPTITVEVTDKKGNRVKQAVSLLAFDEDYLEDDDPELTEQIVARQSGNVVHHNTTRGENMEHMDTPSIDDPANQHNTDFKDTQDIHTSFNDKIKSLLDDINEDDEDVVDEKPVFDSSPVGYKINPSGFST